MRRAKPDAGISQQHLKHFAAAAVAITGLLAVFASGEDWGAKAQISAANARAAQRAANPPIAVKRAQSAGFDDSAGPGVMGDSGGGGGGGTVAADNTGSARTLPTRPSYLPAASPPPGSRYSAAGQSTDQLPDPQAKPQTLVQKGAVSAAQGRVIRAASRQRTGSVEQGD